ncbi:N-acetyltransferase [Protaetiibacter intestinalis]|uniref:N-acetyltransferase n=2 Tax=Protaetiibacter intestinalis TaxID=2419774 RepID=A0A387B525_9MICO|nr:N-acetyltransferase [Protaetiibacter intestinalis]
MDMHIWYRETGQTASGLRLAEAWEDAEHPDGVYLDEVPGDAALVWKSTETDAALLHVTIPEERAPGVPHLWFTAADEPHAAPRACTLSAYTDGPFVSGSIVSPLAFATLGIRGDDELGTVRWLRDGLVVDLYVAPDLRRQGVATCLLLAAGAWQQANRWPGFIHADRPRTRLGRAFLTRLRHPGRVARDAGPRFDEEE